jgi:hypothetical protein
MLTEVLQMMSLKKTQILPVVYHKCLTSMAPTAIMVLQLSNSLMYMDLIVIMDLLSNSSNSNPMFMGQTVITVLLNNSNKNMFMDQTATTDPLNNSNNNNTYTALTVIMDLLHKSNNHKLK